MWPSNAVFERVEAALAVGVLRGLTSLVEIGMRAQRALRERDQRARQDVGALDRDADGNHLVGRLQVVASGHRRCARPPWMSIASLTARRMRSVVWYFISAEMTDGLSPRETIAAVTARAASFDVGGLDHAGERLLDAFHARDRQAELLADAGRRRR